MKVYVYEYIPVETDHKHTRKLKSINQIIKYNDLNYNSSHDEIVR